MTSEQYFRTLATILVISAATAAIAEERTYDPGQLKIACTCSSQGTELADWYHDVKVPRKGFTLDLDKACATTYDNYPESALLCEATKPYKVTFKGREYSYDPEK